MKISQLILALSKIKGDPDFESITFLDGILMIERSSTSNHSQTQVVQPQGPTSQNPLNLEEPPLHGVATIRSTKKP